ncbi:MAG: hypothetical protein JSR47_22690 [Proteobacteria bacterium]|nr:hypothetical protein [Pseudomonadota bacterium]
MDLDKDRLAKLLSMTGSDHDAEALAAIRKANDLLRVHRKSWSDVLGLSQPPIEPPPSQPSTSWQVDRRQAPPQQRPGYQRLRDYRDDLRQQPFLPRLLGFPFWLFVELLALILPRKQLNTRGRFIAIVFALGMLLGIGAWIWLGYYLLL